MLQHLSSSLTKASLRLLKKLSTWRPYFWLDVCQETWVCFLPQIISDKSLGAFVPLFPLRAKGIKTSSLPPKGALRLHSSIALRYSPTTLLVVRYKPKSSTAQVLANFSPLSWFPEAFLPLSGFFHRRLPLRQRQT